MTHSPIIAKTVDHPRQSHSLCEKTSGDIAKRIWMAPTEDDYAVLAIRSLVCDMCMQNGGGHAGSALGMAAIGVALWMHIMRFHPEDPEWINRDRFVLSNGQCACSQLLLGVW